MLWVDVNEAMSTTRSTKNASQLPATDYLAVLSPSLSFITMVHLYYPVVILLTVSTVCL